MKTVLSLADPIVASTLLSGGVVVARTDTIYGVLARADAADAVKKVYELKSRDERKSPIVLISSVDQMYDIPDTNMRRLSEEKWPGPVSIIIPSLNAPSWIRRENSSVAYRLPAFDDLRALITKTGPLIAPSANPESYQPALSIKEAYDYFGDLVDVYVDGGKIRDNTPSQLLRIDNRGNIEQLR